MMVASHAGVFKVLLRVRAEESEVCLVTAGEEAAAESGKHADDAITGRASVSAIGIMRTVRDEEYATNAVVECSEINRGLFDAFRCKMYERTVGDTVTHALYRIGIG